MCYDQLTLSIDKKEITAISTIPMINLSYLLLAGLKNSYQKSKFLVAGILLNC